MEQSLSTSVSGSQALSTAGRGAVYVGPIYFRKLKHPALLSKEAPHPGDSGFFRGPPLWLSLIQRLVRIAPSLFFCSSTSSAAAGKSPTSPSLYCVPSRSPHPSAPLHPRAPCAPSPSSAPPPRLHGWRQ
ncbi:hypothetical protein PAHAL_9G625900 [Panicum hallii]|uniref:Uncharacterized protein n=1 Tax=Panicum hallii TaxID=206008 RepID=A0A2S3IV10_9POAL|nr:hypothetical protein PAHAL_9G625900 [Panicum hallii]PVH33317.1 hypothetical protein PAHAL_9G625900 [Panicum hallii]